MNCLQKIMSCMLLFCLESIDFTATAGQVDQLHNKAYPKKQSFVSTIKQPINQHKIESQQAEKRAIKIKHPESYTTVQANKLIENFIRSVHHIRGSCEQQGRYKANRKPVHAQQVNKARHDYELMYDFFKKTKHKISKQKNDEIKLSINKLFTCKNIKNKVWRGHVDESIPQPAKHT